MAFKPRNKYEHMTTIRVGGGLSRYRWKATKDERVVISLMDRVVHRDTPGLSGTACHLPRKLQRDLNHMVTVGGEVTCPTCIRVWKDAQMYPT